MKFSVPYPRRVSTTTSSLPWSLCFQLCRKLFSNWLSSGVMTLRVLDEVGADLHSEKHKREHGWEKPDVELKIVKIVKILEGSPFLRSGPLPPKGG